MPMVYWAIKRWTCIMQWWCKLQWINEKAFAETYSPRYWSNCSQSHLRKHGSPQFCHKRVASSYKKEWNEWMMRNHKENHRRNCRRWFLISWNGNAYIVKDGSSNRTVTCRQESAITSCGSTVESRSTRACNPVSNQNSSWGGKKS